MTASPTPSTSTGTDAPAKKKYTLRETVTSLGQPRVAGMAALGFSSGMPFMLTGATFGYWLRDEGTALTAIGFLSWVGLAYTFKVFWSPMVDRMKLPVLGRLGQRRSWAVLVQIVIAGGLLAMAAFGPKGPGGLAMLGAFALIVAFASATQDIAIDAWRIEEARDADELGLFTSAYQLGYRIALLVTDALILFFANHLGWPLSYTIMAVLMGVGLFAALKMPEPDRATPSVDAAAATAAGLPVSQRPITAAGVFVAAGLACWLLPFLPKWAWLSPLALQGVHSSFGDAFAILSAVLAVGAFARFVQTWIAGGLAIAAVVLIAFYGAVSGHDLIGGAPMFWPVVLCIVGSALAAPPRVFDAFIGPLLEFFRHHGAFAAVMLLMISVYRLPEFVIGPVAGPFYSDLGLSKDIVAGVRTSIGLIASFSGIAAGGLGVAALGFQRTLVIGAVLQGIGVASFSLLAFYGADLRLFSFAMFADNFCYAFAGVALITYMSSLTSLGYTATQYALLSSLYTVFGKVLKGFSGAVVDGLQRSGRTLMESYGLFYIGAGLIAAPALLLCLVILARRTPVAEPAIPNGSA